MILTFVLSYPFVLQACIDRWAVAKPSCPVCRTSFAAVALEGSSAAADSVDANSRGSGPPPHPSTIPSVTSRGNSAENSRNASSGASATEHSNGNNADIVATWTPVSYCSCLKVVPFYSCAHLFCNLTITYG